MMLPAESMIWMAYWLPAGRLALGVHANEPELGAPETRVAMVFRLLAGPERSSRVMVPEVVGCQTMGNDWPAVTGEPTVGLLMGFSWARTEAAKAETATKAAVKKRIVRVVKSD